MKKLIILFLAVLSLSWIGCKPEADISPISKASIHLNNGTEVFIGNYIEDLKPLLSDTLKEYGFLGFYSGGCAISKDNIANFSNIRSIEILIPNAETATFTFTNNISVKVVLDEETVYGPGFINDPKDQFKINLEEIENPSGTVLGNFHGILHAKNDSIQISSDFQILRLENGSTNLEIIKQLCF